MATTPSIDLKDVHPLTDFLRNTKTHVSRLKRSKSPAVLTVNGRAEIVVQDATSYQKLLRRVEELEEQERFIAAVNEGIADVAAGRTKPFREAFAEVEQRLGIQRQSRGYRHARR